MSKEDLWFKLESIDNVSDRILIIWEDLKKNRSRFKNLALEDPFRFFKLLGGDENEVEQTHNWAFEYTYYEYVEENEIEFDKREEREWDLEQMSIEHANNTGHWYVTGHYQIIGPDNKILNFEFDFCEGYLGEIISTPYDYDANKTHGFLFY